MQFLQKSSIRAKFVAGELSFLKFCGPLKVFLAIASFDFVSIFAEGNF